MSSSKFSEFISRSDIPTLRHIEFVEGELTLPGDKVEVYNDIQMPTKQIVARLACRWGSSGWCIGNSLSIQGSNYKTVMITHFRLNDSTWRVRLERPPGPAAPTITVKYRIDFFLSPFEAN